MDNAGIEYSADDIQVIPATVEGVRTRASMFIGDTERWGANHLVVELVANSIDQFLAGHGSRATVQIDDQDVCVEDDGAGLPVWDIQPDGRSLAEVYLTEYHDSPTADGHAPHIHLSQLGLGLMAPCALSSEFVVETVRNERSCRLRYSKGV